LKPDGEGGVNGNETSTEERYITWLGPNEEVYYNGFRDIEKPMV